MSSALTLLKTNFVANSTFVSKQWQLVYLESFERTYVSKVLRAIVDQQSYLMLFDFRYDMVISVVRESEI